jgi:hypothetical protein
MLTSSVIYDPIKQRKTTVLMSNLKPYNVYTVIFLFKHIFHTKRLPEIWTWHIYIINVGTHRWTNRSMTLQLRHCMYTLYIPESK